MSTTLTLWVLPILYRMAHRKEEESGDYEAAPTSSLAKI